MNKITLFLSVLCIILSFMLGSAIQSKADGKSFAGVVPFATSNGFFGFFNQNDGKFYLYDNNISECTFTGQLDELGKTITKIQAKNTAMIADTAVPFNH